MNKKVSKLLGEATGNFKHSMLCHLFGLLICNCSLAGNELMSHSAGNCHEPDAQHNYFIEKVSKMTVKQQAGKDVYEIIPMPEEKRQYLTEVFGAITGYLVGDLSLKDAEKVLGNGEDHYPKDPSKPITLRIYSEMRFKDFSMQMEKKGGGSNWTYVELGFSPRHLCTYYGLNFDKKYFNGLLLERAETFVDSEYTTDSRKKNRFIYRYEKHGVVLRLIFIADIIYSDIKDGYPKNFSKIQFFRLN